MSSYPYRRMIVASLLTVAGMTLVAAIALGRLPAGTALPIHWGAGGVPDRFADARRALFWPVAGAAGMGILFTILPKIEPLQRNLAQSAALYRTAWGGVLALLAASEVMVAATAFGWHVDGRWSLVATGLLLVVIGNALPKSRPGFFVGIRTPWTLSDPDNWVATHRLGAWTMIVGGGILILTAFLPLGEAAAIHATWLAIAIAAVPPIVYSWWYWRTHRTA